MRYEDPTGEVAETAWDIFSLASEVASFVTNVKQGNVKGAIVDSLGIIADCFWFWSTKKYWYIENC